MPTAPDNHDAHDYAERIRERLPRRLLELREATPFCSVVKSACRTQSSPVEAPLRKEAEVILRVSSALPMPSR